MRSSSRSEYRAVADDRERRRRRPARLLAREPAAGRPGAAFEHAREREVARRSTPEPLADQRRDPVEQRDGQRAPFDDQRESTAMRLRRGLAGSRRRSTPVSTNSPPLRYSARPVRPSMSVTSMPAPLQRLDQRIGEPCESLWSGTRPSVASSRRIAGWRQRIAERRRRRASAGPARSARDASSSASRIARRRQRAVLGAARRDSRRARRGARDPRARTGPARPRPPRRGGAAARRGLRGRPADCPASLEAARELLGVELQQPLGVGAQRIGGIGREARRPRTCAGSRPRALRSARRRCRSPASR